MIPPPLKAALFLLGQGNCAHWGKDIIVADGRRHQP